MQITKKSSARGRDSSEDDTVVGSRFSSALASSEGGAADRSEKRQGRRTCVSGRYSQDKFVKVEEG